MAKEIKIQIFPDGRIQADVGGVKGKKCTDYVKMLEELLDAEATDSSYKRDYEESEGGDIEVDDTYEWRLPGNR
jgi:hypothetical protein